MNRGIWEIGQARLCLPCQAAMAHDYVMRCMGELRRGVCERCGKEAAGTMLYSYTMNKRGLKRIGRLDG